MIIYKFFTFLCVQNILSTRRQEQKYTYVNINKNILNRMDR